MSDSDAPSRLLTRFASRMAQALGLAPKTAPKTAPWMALEQGDMILERQHHADCMVVPMGCVPGCETDDELRGRIRAIVRELDK